MVIALSRGSAAGGGGRVPLPPPGRWALGIGAMTCDILKMSAFSLLTCPCQGQAQSSSTS